MKRCFRFPCKLFSYKQTSAFIQPFFTSESPHASGLAVKLKRKYQSNEKQGSVLGSPKFVLVNVQHQSAELGQVLR